MESVARVSGVRRGKKRAEVIPPGKEFERLTVRLGPYRKPAPAPAVYYYLCDCSCGETCEVRRSNLVSGNTTSCGCAKIEAQTTHGESGTRLHNIRAMMIQRCCNPNYNQFSDYGGRGIGVCDEWRNSYEAFRDWAAANGYANNLELDRKDNDADYCPENCRWVTRKTQARNKRSNRNFTAYGETRCLADWATDPRSKVTQQALNRRLKLGWDFERALTTPPALRRPFQRKSAG